MMTKILIFSSLLMTYALAQETVRDSAEEAIILNQELEFLEETARNVTIEMAPKKAQEAPNGPTRAESLERLYFGTEEDTISSRSAGPKRRRSSAQ